MSRNSCDVGTGAMSFHVVFIVAVVGGTVGGWVWCGVARHNGGRNVYRARQEKFIYRLRLGKRKEGSTLAPRAFAGLPRPTSTPRNPQVYNTYRQFTLLIILPCPCSNSTCSGSILK